MMQLFHKFFFISSFVFVCVFFTELPVLASKDTRVRGDDENVSSTQILMNNELLEGITIPWERLGTHVHDFQEDDTYQSLQEAINETIQALPQKKGDIWKFLEATNNDFGDFFCDIFLQGKFNFPYLPQTDPFKEYERLSYEKGHLIFVSPEEFLNLSGTQESHLFFGRGRFKVFPLGGKLFHSIRTESGYTVAKAYLIKDLSPYLDLYLITKARYWLENHFMEFS